MRSLDMEEIWFSVEKKKQYKTKKNEDKTAGADKKQLFQPLICSTLSVSEQHKVVALNVSI